MPNRLRKKIWNSKIVKDKNRCPTNFDTSINFDWNNKKKQNNTKRNKSNTNTYLALTVPIRLSSAERANAGSSTVTSNFGKTERKTFEYSHHRDPNCDWWSNTLLKPFFYLFLKFLIYILKSFFSFNFIKIFLKRFSVHFETLSDVSLAQIISGKIILTVVGNCKRLLGGFPLR